ncbi:hypothetical protein FEM21_01080 [Flavobacterium seoulense]|uniref:Uncharacterized protein n=1 Tax=Flavobacterium seoulense TaxID=1492738 RepID=A0A066X104_9FLAO|nr:hypothetical protein FEM21_01080 [Flavobacterium seoulense]
MGSFTVKKTKKKSLLNSAKPLRIFAKLWETLGNFAVKKLYSRERYLLEHKLIGAFVAKN